MAGSSEGSAARVGDLGEQRDELLCRAEKLLVQHGHSAAKAKAFLGQMKRPDKFGEGFLLVALSEYLERSPAVDGKPIDPKEWIFWKVRELIGRPVMLEGAPIRIP